MAETLLVVREGPFRPIAGGVAHPTFRTGAMIQAALAEKLEQRRL